jgi:RNA polymerase sigma-70 factor (ECF subfamily)
VLDDRTLVERCREGDDLAWEVLVRRFQRRVFGVAYGYLRSREEARDMAQEIFVRLYERLDSFRGGDRFLPWLLSMARNACIDRLRRQKARPPASDLSVDDGPEIPDAAADPEQEAEAEGRRRLLYRALARMSHTNREMILLKEIQGLKLEEIATMLALPLGTVKSRSNRARVELATKIRGLDPSYGTPGGM